jgi:hypothetical protein
MAKKQTSNATKNITSKLNAPEKNQSFSSGERSKEQIKISEIKKTEQKQQELMLTHEQISERAKAIWQQRGCPSGDDQRNWFEAENQLKQELGVGS